jgi:hypothetical protein
MVSVETKVPRAALAAAGMASSSARVMRGLVEAVAVADLLSGVSKIKCLRTVSAAPREAEVLPRVVWLRKGEPKLERMAWDREARVMSARQSGGTESNVANAGRASGGVGGNGSSDAVTKMVAETQRDEIVDMKNQRTKIVANVVNLKSGVAGASGDVTREGSKQLGRAAKRRVRHQQIGKEVEATSFQVTSSGDSRSRRHGQLDGVSRTTEGQRDKSSR